MNLQQQRVFYKWPRGHNIVNYQFLPMTTARRLAFDLLQQLETSPRHSDELLHGMLDESGLARPDRALATAMVGGVLRQRLLLDFIISHFYHHDLNKASPAIRNILRLGTWQLLFLDRVPRWAAVDESVKIARRCKGERLSKLVNGVLRKISPDTLDLDSWLEGLDEAEQLSVRHSHPRWLVERWLATYGSDRTTALLEAANSTPWFGFRQNPLKAQGEGGKSAASIEAATTPSGIEGLFLSREFAPFETLLDAGLLSVQNPTQALPCLLLDPKPGQSIVDLCAAPGGKSALLAELTGDRGRIASVDRYPQKVRRIESLATKLGITTIEAFEADARGFVPPFRPDAILLDAPCTGTGVLGRRAELRWRLQPETIRELVQLQAALLDHAASLLDQDGVLLYATCSIEAEENQLQTEAFLQRHPEFEADPSPGALPELFAAELDKGGLLTLPGTREGFDGGYCRRMRKRSNSG